jgi:hypothetical protein
VNDDDNGSSRDAKVSWNANTDTAWKNPRVFGELVLEGSSSQSPTDKAVLDDKTSVVKEIQ